MKQLKQLVRDIIDPSRDLGHIDRHTQGKSDKSPDIIKYSNNEQAEPVTSKNPDVAVAFTPPGETKGGAKGEEGVAGCKNCA